jgi:diguanylate cyclase (GGDEF)-like protein/PAS domain S-box-containing protein
MNYDLTKEIFDSLFEGAYIVDDDRKIIFWNKGAEKITGFKKEEVIGKYCHDNILNHVTADGTLLCFGGCPLHNSIITGNENEAEVFLHHKDGHRVPIKVKTVPYYDNGAISGAIEFFKDYSTKIELKNTIESLNSVASLDHLTGLYNRRYFEAFIESKLGELRNFDLSFGITFFDIDDFKIINDTFGHLLGDDVLKIIAKTATNSTRGNDIVCRWGGEEFVAVFLDIDEEKLRVLAERLRTIVENSSLRASDNEIKFTISIGATMARADDTTESLLHRADKLMYKSKQNGKNQSTLG